MHTRSFPVLPFLILLLSVLSGCGAPEESRQEVVINDDAAVAFTGAFSSLNHATSGTLRIEVDDADRARVLFLDDFRVDNGPALVVGLSPRAVAGMNDGNAWPAATIELGDLAGARGAQEYAVPAGVDFDEFSSVVVWCEDFFVAFGAASFAVDDAS